MHELSLANAIFDTVERHAAGRKVTSVQMKIGTMRQVVPDSLDFYFHVVTKDTLCEGARFDQEIITARLKCRDCSKVWELDGIPDFRCPACPSTDVEVLAGTEFEVESIEVEDVNEATASPSQDKEKARA
jgi:hydrogenase nickel incorporation protein HypA/HybF